MRLKERQLRRCASHYDQINLDNIFLSNVKEEWVSTTNVEDMLARDEEDDFTWLDVSVIDAPNALNFLDDNPICCLLKWILIILYYFVLQWLLISMLWTFTFILLHYDAQMDDMLCQHFSRQVKLIFLFVAMSNESKKFNLLLAVVINYLIHSPLIYFIYLTYTHSYA